MESRIINYGEHIGELESFKIFRIEHSSEKTPFEDNRRHVFVGPYDPKYTKEWLTWEHDISEDRHSLDMDEDLLVHRRSEKAD